MIDFHTHILPGIDDGSKNTEMSEKMLLAAKEQGIDTIIATPHFYADSMRIESFCRNRELAYQQIRPLAENLGIRLICGAEVSFFSGISHVDDINALCIGNSKNILIEMPFRSWGEHDLKEIAMLLRKGYQPIIAHLERYYSFSSNKKIISQLFEYPVYIQINAEALLHWNSRRLAVKLFDNEQAHLLGSDCHNLTGRPENLAEGRKILLRKLGKEKLSMLDEAGEFLLRHCQ